MEELEWDFLEGRYLFVCLWGCGGGRNLEDWFGDFSEFSLLGVWGFFVFRVGDRWYYFRYSLF